MPTNIPELQTIEAEDIELTDYVYISRRDSTSRGLKNTGVVDKYWFIPFGELVDAIVAELDSYEEPDWTVI